MIICFFKKEIVGIKIGKEKEENEGNSLSKEDKKYLGKYIPKFYQIYLKKEKTKDD